MTPAATLATGHHPRVRPRLVVPEAAGGALDLAAETALGTYAPVRVGDVIAELERAGLRGRGGAAFPAHRKWAQVAGAGGGAVVVANGAEAEPTSWKDRWLLTHRPHLVLDGLLLAAVTVGATRAVVYASDPDAVAALTRAVDELSQSGAGLALRPEIRTAPPRYVAGEETAVCRALSGGPALPLSKPPRPAERGVDGRPTLVSNVETLAQAAWIARHGAAAYRAYGTATSPGTTLVTLGGACARPGVYEVPFGLPVPELFDLAGGFTATPVAYATGGWFGGLLAADRAAVACGYDELRAAGAGLGCGAITAIGPDADLLTLAEQVASWYARESAGQCGVCRKATAAIRDAFTALRRGRQDPPTVADLARWGSTLPGRGACGLLDGAAAWPRTLAAQFPGVLQKASGRDVTAVEGGA